MSARPMGALVVHGRGTGEGTSAWTLRNVPRRPPFSMPCDPSQGTTFGNRVSSQRRAADCRVPGLAGVDSARGPFRLHRRCHMEARRERLPEGGA